MRLDQQELHGKSHDMPVDCLAYCRGSCHRAQCHKHALLLRRSHTSDSLLDARDDQVRYHSRHTVSKAGGDMSGPQELSNKEVFDQVFGPTYGYPNSDESPPTSPKIYELDPSTRLTWAAIAYPNCNPVAAKNSVLGFYDEEVSRDIYVCDSLLTCSR